MSATLAEAPIYQVLILLPHTVNSILYCTVYDLSFNTANTEGCQPMI